MESNLAIIRALTAALLSELDTLNINEENITENNFFDFKEKVKEFEIKLIKTALLNSNGNQRQTAKLLGLPTSTLNSKIKAYNIQCIKDS